MTLISAEELDGLEARVPTGTIVKLHEDDFRALIAQARRAGELEGLVSFLEPRVEYLESAVHSCHPDCKMAGCVNRRLREQLEDLQMKKAKSDFGILKEIIHLRKALERTEAALGEKSDG
jgi:hypothetical protein